MSRLALALVYALNVFSVGAFAAVVEGPKGEPVPSIAPLAPLALTPALPLIDSPAPKLEGVAAIPKLAATTSLPQAASAQAAPVQAAKPTVAGRLRAFASASTRVFANPSVNAGNDRRAVDFTLSPSRNGASDAEPVATPRTSQSAPQLLARPPSGSGPRKAPRGVRAYVAGTFGAQLANNALQVTLPLLLIQVSGPAAAAWVTGVSTLLDTAGTLVGGWLSTRASPAKVLVVSSLARAFAVAAIPVVMLTHAPGVAALAAIACVDALARGIADTSRKTVPTILASDGDGIRQINSSYQTAFEAGGVAGPALVGLLMTQLGGAAAQWVAPAAFAVIAGVYSFIPRGKPQARTTSSSAEDGAKPAPAPAKNTWLLKAVVATGLLTLYPLKGVLPAVFASGVLHHPSAAAWLAAAFGVGGVIGSRIYARWNKKLPLSGWLKAGAAGAVFLGLAWLPGSLYAAAAGVLLFATLNSAARVAQDSDIMEKARGPEAGKAIGWARFASNITSASLRFLVGGAFALAGGQGGWLLIAAGLAGIGALAWWNAGHRLLPRLLLGVGLAVSPQAARRNIFDKDPAGDAPNIRRNYRHATKGPHFYFRNALLPMQERFAQLMDLRGMPKVFLHGSPHVDNYAKSANGAAMVDFDRARVGPYAWDIVRLMVSISLRRKKLRGFLDPKVLKQLKKGYLHGLRHPDRPFSEMRELKDRKPERDERSVDAYLAANGKWAEEMRNDPLPVDSPKIESLVAGYLANRGERREDYTIEEAGRGEGSMGFRAIYLVVLKHRDPHRDRLLLNFKQARTDPDTEWYTNPYDSETERMLEAAELYAPDWELAPGWVKLDGVEYYVRGIPPQNAKLKKMLGRGEQKDFAYAVGTQLGRAHALSSSMNGSSAAQLERRFKDDFEGIAASGETIRDEILAAHERYLKRMKKEGLEPDVNEKGDE